MNRKDAEKKARALVGKMTLREKASQLRFDSPAIERLGIPAYNWWNEALHGVARGGTATSFPQAIGLAATFDEALLEKLGDAAATEGRAKYTSSLPAGTTISITGSVSGRRISTFSGTPAGAAVMRPTGRTPV